MRFLSLAFALSLLIGAPPLAPPLAKAAGTAPSSAPSTPPGPVVVASIPPIHALVAGVMSGTGAPHLLIPGGASPHSYALRPADARQLEAARLVFWIGPSLETLLTRSLRSLAKDATIVTLTDTPDITLRYETAEPGHHGHGHGHGHGHDQDDHHDKTAEPARRKHVDPHIWLDPANAIAMTQHIAAMLAKIDPARAVDYRANADRLTVRLKTLDRDIAARLAPVAHVPFLTFHDAYGYFTNRYGLAARGAITLSPERKPGAAAIGRIRAQITHDKVRCVFAEPQFPPKLIATVIEGTGARTGTLDPIGAELTPGADAYPAMIQNLARDLTRCLSTTN